MCHDMHRISQNAPFPMDEGVSYFLLQQYQQYFIVNVLPSIIWYRHIIKC